MPLGSMPCMQVRLAAYLPHDLPLHRPQGQHRPQGSGGGGPRVAPLVDKTQKSMRTTSMRTCSLHSDT